MSKAPCQNGGMKIKKSFGLDRCRVKFSPSSAVAQVHVAIKPGLVVPEGDKRALPAAHLLETSFGKFGQTIKFHGRPSCFIRTKHGALHIAHLFGSIVLIQYRGRACIQWRKVCGALATMIEHFPVGFTRFCDAHGFLGLASPALYRIFAGEPDLEDSFRVNRLEGNALETIAAMVRPTTS